MIDCGSLKPWKEKPKIRAEYWACGHAQTRVHTHTLVYSSHDPMRKVLLCSLLQMKRPRHREGK